MAHRFEVGDIVWIANPARGTYKSVGPIVSINGVQSYIIHSVELYYQGYIDSYLFNEDEISLYEKAPVIEGDDVS